MSGNLIHSILHLRQAVAGSALQSFAPFYGVTVGIVSALVAGLCVCHYANGKRLRRTVRVRFN